MTLPDHTQVILGPPGTGKTSTLLGLIEDELEQGTDPTRIGFFTFTKKAVNEGKQRAMERFELTQKDLPFFRTLHSLAFRQLGLSKESVMDTKDIRELNEVLNIRLTGGATTDSGHLFGMTHDDRLAFIENLARMRQIPLEDQWHEVDDAVGWFELERYARGLVLFKEDKLLVDYTDMLKLFLEKGDVPKFDAVFVDEAQDLSPLQWAVVRKVIKNADRVYVAGDDDQAIYKWAGADVDYLIKNAGNATILEQSYRIPSAVHELASRCIGQVRSRIHKTWLPKKETGLVRWEPSIELIDMEKGDWLVLARTNYLLEQIDEHCRNEGWFFEVKGRPSISESKVRAVLNWERLLTGAELPVAECVNLLKFIKVRNPNSLDVLDIDVSITLEGLRYRFPDLPEGHWYDALTSLSPKDISYLRAMLRRGERITKEPRIRLSTIHAAKGGEATNVVLLTDITNRVYKNYQENPDDENRVFYVGLTRAKENLYLIEPSTTRCFQI
jgi:DNA helicase-2/ATP-dependent DNA helicase PcrA|tara:strand:+ start:2759 stop:4255 length:1497 start_codon:yes stop_codon:yes gene_type:complete